MSTPKILSRSTFGPFNRFQLVEFRTRFGNTEWHVTDASTVSDKDVMAGKLPETIAQEASPLNAMAVALSRV